MSLTKISIEGNPDYETYYARVASRRWNGWAVPSFPSTELARFAAELENAGGDQIKIHFDTNACQWVLTTWVANRGPKIEEPVSEIYVERVSPDAEGLYLVDLGIVWYEVEEDYDEEEKIEEHTLVLDNDIASDILGVLRSVGRVDLVNEFLAAKIES